MENKLNTNPELVYLWIYEAKMKLMEKGTNYKHIKVLMPNYYHVIMDNYFHGYSLKQTLIKKGSIKVFNISILPHYKNEIVIYDEMWNRNTPNTAQILEL